MVSSEQSEASGAVPLLYSAVMLRVRFAPSPTGFLHVGSARTFIFNWLYARRHGGTMVLRLDDTDVERNTDASVNSIYEGLRWLDLGWDEEYKQSERLGLHRQIAESIFGSSLLAVITRDKSMIPGPSLGTSASN